MLAPRARRSIARRSLFSPPDHDRKRGRGTPSPSAWTQRPSCAAADGDETTPARANRVWGRVAPEVVTYVEQRGRAVADGCRPSTCALFRPRLRGARPRLSLLPASHGGRREGAFGGTGRVRVSCGLGQSAPDAYRPDDLLEGDLQPAGDEARRQLKRVHAASEYIDTLRSADPYLVEPQALQELLNQMQSLFNALNRYASDPRNELGFCGGDRGGNVPGILTVVRIHFLIGSPISYCSCEVCCDALQEELAGEVARLRTTMDELQNNLDETQHGRAEDVFIVGEKLEALSQTIQEQTLDRNRQSNDEAPSTDRRTAHRLRRRGQPAR